MRRRCSKASAPTMARSSSSTSIASGCATARRCSASSCRGRSRRSTPPASEVLKANGLTDAYMRPVAWRGAESMGRGRRDQAAHGDRRLGMGQILRSAQSRAGHSPGDRAVAPARALYRADGIEGGGPVHDLHLVEAACRGSWLRRRLDVRLARTRGRGDRAPTSSSSATMRSTRRCRTASSTGSPGAR